MYKLTILNPASERFQLTVGTDDELVGLKRKLFEEGSAILKTEKVSGGLFRRRFSGEELFLITRVFETISSSSIPIVQGVKIEALEGGDQRTKDFFTSLRYQLESGHSLTASIKNTGFVFPGIYLGMTAAGEKSGKLAETFSLLSGYLKKSNQIRKDLINAAIYPAILATATILSFIFIANFVVPQFADLYASLGKKLPAATQMALWVFDFSKRYFLMILLAAIGFSVLVWASIRNPRLVGSVTAFALKIPFARIWVSDFFLYRFLKVLSIQLSGGENIVKSLETIKDLYIENLFFSAYTQKILTGVSQGLPLSKSMSNEIPAGRAILYINLGELAGKTSTYLDEASKFFEERVNQRLVALEKSAQPVLIFIVGTLIAAMAVSLFLPLYTASSIIK